MGKKTIVAPEASRNQIFEMNEVQNSEPLDQETPEHQRALRRVELRKQFISIAEQVAESKLFFKNYKYQGADQLYPNPIHAHQRFVDKCFPHAKGGMLLVDEPRSEKQIELAQEKHQHLVKKGFRHLIIIDGKTTYYDCLEQLGEFDVDHSNG